MNTAVLGAGSFGTALAMQLARCGHSVRLWERSPARARLIEKTRMNERYLPGYRLDSAVSVGSDVDWVLANAELAVLAIPSQALREALTNLRPHLPQDTILCCAAKGVEQGSLLTMEEVMSQVLETDRRICVISGPSFAAEVARGEPTAVVVAGKDPSATKRVAEHTCRRAFPCCIGYAGRHFRCEDDLLWREAELCRFGNNRSNRSRLGDFHCC